MKQCPKATGVSIEGICAWDFLLWWYMLQRRLLLMPKCCRAVHAHGAEGHVHAKCTFNIDY